MKSAQVAVRERGSIAPHPGCSSHRRSYDWILEGKKEVVMAQATYDEPCLKARLQERTNDGALTLWLPTGGPVVHEVGGRRFLVKRGDYHLINVDELNRPALVGSSGKGRWTTLSFRTGWMDERLRAMGLKTGGLILRWDGNPRPLPPRLSRAAEELWDCLEEASAFGQTALVASAAAHVFELLLALHPNTARDEPSDVDAGSPDLRMRQAVRFLEEHYYRPLRMEEIAEAAAISVRHLTTLFRQQFRTTPSNYLRAFRVQRAIERLHNEPHLTLEAIAEAVGYGDVRALRAAFQAEKKRSPSSFR